MAKKKNPQTESPSPEPQAPPSEAFVTRTAPDSVPPPSGGSKRLVLKFDESGQIDWDRLTAEQKTEFGKAIGNDATALELIGLAASDGSSSDPGAPPGDGALSLDMPIENFQIEQEDVKDIFLALNWFSKYSLKFAMKKINGFDIKPEILKQAFEYKENELERLSTKGTKVANKYAPEWFKKYFDEISLVLLFGSVLSRQCQTAIAMQAMQNMVDAQARPKTTGGDHSKNKSDARPPIPMVDKQEEKTQ